MGNNLRNKGVITLKDWCKSNGYDGVTKECMLSASNSNSKDVIKLVKKEKIKGIVKNGRV